MRVYITPSWGRDLEAFRALRRTMRPLGLDHVAVVHTEDLPAFAEFQHDEHLTLLPTSAVLPPGAEVARLRQKRRRRDPRYWVTRRWLPGYVAQQVTKLAFADQCPTSEYVCIDSDVLLLRPISAPEGCIFSQPLRWMVEAQYIVDAQRFFGVDPQGMSVESHTSWIQVLDVACVRALQEAIEANARGVWWRTLRRRRLNEYETYATVALERHARSIPLPVVGISSWQPREELESIIERIHRDPPDAVGVQSTMPDAEAWRERVLKSVPNLDSR